MVCDQESKLQAYMDGELPSAEMFALDAHLRICTSCAASALSQLQMKQLTRVAGKKYFATREARSRILEKVFLKAKRTWYRRFLPQLVTVAAVLLVGGGTLLIYSRSQQHTLYRELADFHVSSLASGNPFDVASSDRHTVKPWFQGKLPFSFNIPELQGSAYRLLGGRLVYVEQSPAADLLFAYQQHRISVFIFQDRHSFFPDRSKTSSDVSFSTETWTQDGLRYVAITDASPNVLQGLHHLWKFERS